MPKTNCNIIKDLLPSYVEDLCSNESQNFINEHFEECKQCHTLYLKFKKKMYQKKNHNTKEFDYLKKIKNSVFHKNILIYSLIALIFLIQFYCTFYQYRFETPFLIIVSYLFPLLIIGILFFILPDYAEKEVSKKLKFTILGTEFSIMTYITALFIYLMHNIQANYIPFGLKIDKIGPFFANQLIVFQIIFTFAFCITLYLSSKKKCICPALHFLPIGGFSLANQYLIMLHTLTDTISIWIILKPFFIITLSTIILICFYQVIHKKHTLPNFNI